MQELTLANEPRPSAKRPKRKQEAQDSATAIGSVLAAKELADQPADHTTETEMMTLGAVCIFFGGDRPLNPSTLYRGVRAGQYPPPVLLGPNNPRWLRSECRQALERLVKERNKYSSSRWLRQADAEAA